MLACSQAQDCEAVWTEDSDNVTVGVFVDEDVRGKQVTLDVHPTRMALAIQGTMVLEGDFPSGHEAIPDGSFFEMEEKDGKRVALVTLEKKTASSQWLEFFSEDQIDLAITNKATPCPCLSCANCIPCTSVARVTWLKTCS